MMQNIDEDNAIKTNHRKVKRSATLNRRYAKRPSASADSVFSVKRSPSIRHFNTQVSNGAIATTKQPMRAQPVRSSQQEMPIQMQRVATTSSMVSNVTARELKDQAITTALAAAKKEEETKEFDNHMHFGIGRVLIALACATAAVFAIVYFVNLNVPDISLKVAAMQTGIDPSYPGYIPRGYRISSITSEEGKLIMEFRNSSNGDEFSLTEEKSSWDSNALESNYVKKTFDENYSIVREQGLTIYISGSDAAWVNGGNVFKLSTKTGSLSNKQIRAIATSL